MLCLSGFELYSRWVPLICIRIQSGALRSRERNKNRIEEQRGVRVKDHKTSLRSF